MQNLYSFSFVFYKGDGLVARTIKVFTKGKYSHVGLMIDNIHIIQLDYKTPVSIHHLNYIKGDYDVYEYIGELSDDEKCRIVDFMKMRLSTKYDFKLIFSRMFNILFNTQIRGSDEKYNCDELIVDAFRSVGINLIEKDIRMTPDELSKSKLLVKRKEA